MANVFSSNPVTLSADTTTGAGTNWRGASGGSQFVGKIGIRPCKIVITPTTGATTAGTVTINEIKSDGTTTGALLFQAQIATLGATASIAQEFDFVGASPGWKDWIVTGLTATGTTIEIWYRV